MKKYKLILIAALAAAFLGGCGTTSNGNETTNSVSEAEKTEIIDPLENDYICISDYCGIEVAEKVYPEVTEENVDDTIAYMLRQYAHRNDLDADTIELTDEIVQELSKKSTTVEEYRQELWDQIEKSREDTIQSTYEAALWETVVTNTTVKEYPEDELQHEYENLVELYESYAAMDGVTYEEYMTTVKLTDDDLHEAAEAAMKQNLIAQLIVETYGLEPTEEEVETATQGYVDAYYLQTKEVLYTYISEEDVYGMILQDITKAWLVDNCAVVVPAE